MQRRERTGRKQRKGQAMANNRWLNLFLKKLKACRHRMTIQQYNTFKGQAMNGDILGAEKGLCRYIHDGKGVHKFTDETMSCRVLDCDVCRLKDW